MEKQKDNGKQPKDEKTAKKDLFFKELTQKIYENSELLSRLELTNPWAYSFIRQNYILILSLEELRAEGTINPAAEKILKSQPLLELYRQQKEDKNRINNEIFKKYVPAY